MSFKRLDPEDFVLSAEAVTNALWTGFSPKLARSEEHTSELQSH